VPQRTIVRSGKGRQNGAGVGETDARIRFASAFS
jgi:hypothetical protein